MRVYEKIPQSDMSLLPRLMKGLDGIIEDGKEKEKKSIRITDSMYLYFDFEDYNATNYLNHIKLLDLSLEIYKIDSEMEISAKIYEESQEPKMKEIIFDDMKKRYPEYFPKLEELVNFLKNVIDETKQQQKKIISEMKKYDL